MLTLADVLAIEPPLRDRLQEADDAVRDLVRALEAEAQRHGQDRDTLSHALVGVLMAAAARQARAAYPSLSRSALSAGFAELAEEAIDWAAARGVDPRRRRTTS